MADFDLCVIGSGAGHAILTSRFADWRVALIDGQAWSGGTCQNRGCVPSAMLTYPADLAEAARHGSELGVSVGPVTADWAAMRERILGRINLLAESAEGFWLTQPNIAVFGDRARFIEPKTVLVAGQEVTADRFVIAAGSRPQIPEVPGLDSPELKGRIHTPDSIMRLEKLPASLVIVGGGVDAAEFAHIFSAFGTAVTVLHRGTRLLRRADDAVADRFAQLLGQRVVLRYGQRLSWVEDAPHGVEVGTVDDDGIEYSFSAEHLLIAAGRVSTADTLELYRTGVEVDPITGRIVVDDYQRTSSEGIYALSDASSPWQLRSVAHHEARVVRHNLLNPKEPIAADHRYIPQVVFSGPQVAWVGLNEAECQDQGRDFVVGTCDYGGVAYGWAMEDDGHFVKVIADRGTGRLLGAHIVGPQATILIQPLVQAISLGTDVGTLVRGQHWVHPALSEVIENALLAIVDQ